MILKNKKIILGVTGGIAAYKTPLLVRLLKKAGAEVQVIVTPSALNFVTATTLATVSGRPVLNEFIRNSQGEWNNHVALGLWADLLLITPLTANTLSKMAHGLCDNLLMAVYLSMRNKTLVAPAMDLDMMVHPSVVKNLETLKSFGVEVMDARDGELASGLSGKGRMAEPEEIFEEVSKLLGLPFSFAGKKVLITAGPTYEKIDPVRFIGNHSSGKMGYAIASIFEQAGAEVTLVSGPTSIAVPNGIKLVRVESANEMFEACNTCITSYDIAIMSAAVADFRPEQVAEEKIKKGNNENLNISLVKNPDILKHFGTHKKTGQFLVGFALETENLKENALKKLHSKNADLIVLNTPKEEGAGFNSDTNAVWLIDSSEQEYRINLSAKERIAYEIAQFIFVKTQNNN